MGNKPPPDVSFLPGRKQNDWCVVIAREKHFYLWRHTQFKSKLNLVKSIVLLNTIAYYVSYEKKHFLLSMGNKSSMIKL